MKYYLRLLIFLIINFGALGIGTLLMNNGPTSEWYIKLSKAPWTPPGWVFGFAWTTIMICFSFYMTKLTLIKNSKTVIILFGIQFILNVSWNYLFFNQHLVFLGMITLVLLLMIITLFTIRYTASMKRDTILILPYLLWLLVACSLNGYILINN